MFYILHITFELLMEILRKWIYHINKLDSIPIVHNNFYIFIWFHCYRVYHISLKRKPWNGQYISLWYHLSALVDLLFVSYQNENKFSYCFLFFTATTIILLYQLQQVLKIKFSWQWKNALSYLIDTILDSFIWAFSCIYALNFDDIANL